MRKRKHLPKSLTPTIYGRVYARGFAAAKKKFQTAQPKESRVLTLAILVCSAVFGFMIATLLL